VGMRPVFLVHGAFGTGKSNLLVVLVLFLLQLFGRRGADSAAQNRILIASATNTAGRHCARSCD
jgi:hypothetical protein